MKKIIFLMAFAWIHAISFSQTSTRLKDGLYLVAEVVKDSTQSIETNRQNAFVHFNKLFLKNAPKDATGLVVYTNNFVPLELEKEPELVQQAENKKKLQLSFSRLASDKLTGFTSNNIMKQATLIVNGEALTINKIRAAITDGKMEITRCDDNACETIYAQLKDKVKH
jgi:hypothetical protein